MVRFLIILCGLAVILGAFFTYQHHRAPSQTLNSSSAQSLSVVATFYPLEEFAKGVTGDVASVRSIVPGGAEPHDYEPTPKDIQAVYQSSVFLVNGSGLDGWAEKLRPDLEKKGITVLVMSEKLPGVASDDPHFWLDPALAEQEVMAIRDALIAKDPMHKDEYTENANTYLKKLADLDTLYRQTLSNCKQKTIVTSHEAFGYLAKRYGFQALGVTGISPEAEPSPSRLAELASIVRSQGIQYIFFETLVSPKVAQTLAQETGAQTLVFNPIEGLTDEERKSGASYFTIMQDNLKALTQAMQCQKS